MMVRVGVLAALVAASPIAAQQQSPATTNPSAPRPAAARDSGTKARTAAASSMVPADTLVASVDAARAMDAETHAALFDLMNGRTVSAYERLTRLLSALPSDASTAQARSDATFLLAEAQYKLGMDSAFNATAAAALAAGSGNHYAPLLQAQQLLTVYRDGDYARVTQLAASLPKDATQGLASLVSGLASYQLRQYPQARTAFAATIAAGPRYAPYARYMDILTQLRTDTTGTASAISALQTLAGTQKGTLADQIGLTAAQLAYQSGQYDQAATIADRVAANGDLAPDALLTKAWAQYKAGHIPEAGQTFAAFATRFPQLPERDESRLMAAQAMLQSGSSADAEKLFRLVSDSADVEGQQLKGATTVGDAARVLVANRLAGLLSIADPNTGKSVELHDIAGADGAVLAAAMSADSAPPLPSVSLDRLLSYGELQKQLDAVKDSLGSVPRRIFFTPAPAGGKAATTYAVLSDALYAADAAVLAAQRDLTDQTSARGQRMAMLTAVQKALATRRATFDSATAYIRTAEERAAKEMPNLDLEVGRIKAVIQNDAALTQRAAQDNLAIIQTERSRGGNATTLDLETQAAQQYGATAAYIASNVDAAIGHNTIFGIRDSLRIHSQATAALLGDAQQSLASAAAAVDADLARLRAADTTGSQQLRATLASAQARRDALETQLRTAVQTELQARAGEVLAQLQRDREAATFGVASASFFQAIDQNQPGGAGSANTTGGTASTVKGGAPVASTVTPPSKQK